MLARGIDEPVLKDGIGGTVYYHRNSQYSVCALTNSSGAVVERYGCEPCGELTIPAADSSTVRASSSYAIGTPTPVIAGPLYKG